MNIDSSDDSSGGIDSNGVRATAARLRIVSADLQHLEALTAELGRVTVGARTLRPLERGRLRDTDALTPNGRRAEDRTGAVQETMKCLVCQEDEDASDTIELICGHSFCRDCLPEVFRHAMNFEAHFPASCCDFPISRGAVRPFLTRELEREYEAKAIEFKTPNRTYCHDSHCGAFILEIREGKAKCPKCGKVTCAECKEKEHMGHCICGAEFCYACGARYSTCVCKNRLPTLNDLDDIGHNLREPPRVEQQPRSRQGVFSADLATATEQIDDEFEALLNFHPGRDRLAERISVPRNPFEIVRQVQRPVQRQRQRRANQNDLGVNEHRERRSRQSVATALVPGSGNEGPRDEESFQNMRSRHPEVLATQDALVDTTRRAQTSLLPPIPSVRPPHGVLPTNTTTAVDPPINNTYSNLHHLPIFFRMDFGHGRAPVFMNTPADTADLRTLPHGARFAMEVTVPPNGSQPAVIGTVEGVYRKFGISFLKDEDVPKSCDPRSGSGYPRIIDIVQFSRAWLNSTGTLGLGMKDVIATLFYEIDRVKPEELSVLNLSLDDGIEFFSFILQPNNRILFIPFIQIFKTDLKSMVEANVVPRPLEPQATTPSLSWDICRIKYEVVRGVWVPQEWSVKIMCIVDDGKDKGGIAKFLLRVVLDGGLEEYSMSGPRFLEHAYLSPKAAKGWPRVIDMENYTRDWLEHLTVADAVATFLSKVDATYPETPDRCTRIFAATNDSDKIVYRDTKEHIVGETVTFIKVTRSLDTMISKSFKMLGSFARLALLLGLQARLREELLSLYKPHIYPVLEGQDIKLPDFEVFDDLPLLDAGLQETLRVWTAVPGPQPRVPPSLSYSYTEFLNTGKCHCQSKVH
ncbi:hypothetical protein B7494_g8091 [Chlorociboria aeruginascens]|nr:hypothetical protein B7494_g8091 [Chlorociboria aeruginascens]